MFEASSMCFQCVNKQAIPVKIDRVFPRCGPGP